ncbi:MAG TPA: TIGR03435 family protein, partial [Bryobacteraceae bacterium]
MARLLLPLSLVLCSLAAYAQDGFEAASIHPTKESVPNERDGSISAEHGTLRLHDVTLKSCIHYAYGISAAQIVGGTNLSGERYDILATAGRDLGDAELRRMLQGLLAERYHLTLHHEQREMRGYLLSVAPGGVKASAAIHAPAAEGEPTHQNSEIGFTARNFSMKDLAAYLASPLDGPVADETGLTGRYDISVDFRRYVNTGPT